jgi:hypothetical protein
MTLDGAVQAAETSRALVAALGEVSMKARRVSAKMELFSGGSTKTIDEICLDLRAASGIAQAIRHTFDTGIATAISDGLMRTAESPNLSDVQEFSTFLSLIDHWSGEAAFLHKGIEGIVRRRGVVRAEVPQDGSSRMRVARLAERLLTCAARCLPEVHRERYVEEFRGELWSVAQAGGRLRQLAYAVRQIARVMVLRHELKSRHRYRATR